MFCYNLNCVTDTIPVLIFAVQAQVHQHACHQRSGISFIYKALGISPFIAEGFYSGLGMVSAMGMEEEVTLGPFVPGVSAEAFGQLHT